MTGSGGACRAAFEERNEAMKPSVWIAVACGAFIITVSMGVRQTFGLFLAPISIDLGIGREVFGLAVALQQIFWGLFQPACGMVADRYGTGRVLLLGTVAYMVGLAIMATAQGAVQLNIGLGVFTGFAMAATSFSVVLGALGRIVPPERRSAAFGIASAGGSLGQFVMAPIGQGFIAAFDWSGALLAMVAIAALMAPLALALRGKAGDAVEGSLHGQSIKGAVAEAMGHGGYRYLTAGFFVCGFHVAFIGFHLPAYVGDLGLAPGVGATALALIGFFNIIGTYVFGVLGGRHSKKMLLAGLYGLRAVVIAVFLVAPKNEISVLALAAAMGLLWLGTVPLTSGLVAQIFGVKYMATLFGIVFFSHQAGSFLGAWMGGWLYDLTGSYDMMWWISIALGVVAALLHLPIAEQPLRPAMQRA